MALLSLNENHLIERLPRKDRLHLLAICEPVQLALGDVLCEPGQATRHVYFPVDAFIALLTQVDGHANLEIGMVGREGMLGASLALGETTTPLRAIVLGPGAARRVDSIDFQREMARSVALQRNLSRYVVVMMAQLASSAACLRFHAIAPRLARWLLMSQDRAHADSFHVTHELLAFMLGVRRVGITTAAGSLQRLGLIQYRRGELTVLDRQGLEANACSCYATDQRTYAEFLT